jgi:hypothetical protein
MRHENASTKRRVIWIRRTVTSLFLRSAEIVVGDGVAELGRKILAGDGDVLEVSQARPQRTHGLSQAPPLGIGSRALRTRDSAPAAI